MFIRSKYSGHSDWYKVRWGNFIRKIHYLLLAINYVQSRRNSTNLSMCIKSREGEGYDDERVYRVWPADKLVYQSQGCSLIS